MAERSSAKPKAPEEQIKYADLLYYGAWIGILIMFITYFIYVVGILPAHVPLAQVPAYWSHPVEEYLHNANVPQGWGWVHLLGTGDFLNFIGIVLLAGMTIICFCTLIPAYLKKNDKLFAVIVVAEVAVLCVAASGLLGSGGGH